MSMNPKGSEGSTLLELVLSLAIFAASALLVLTLLLGQLAVYRIGSQTGRAMELAGQTYRELERRLRFGYDFEVRADRPEELSFCRWTGMELREQLTLSDLDVGAEEEGMALSLNFTGASAEEAQAELVVTERGRVIYRETMTFPSLRRP